MKELWICGGRNKQQMKEEMEEQVAMQGRKSSRYYATQKKRNTFRQWFMILSFPNK